MDGNVFAEVVGGDNQQARSRAALNDRNCGSKYDNALAYLKDLKKQFGDGVSTLCLVYNATGEPITFVTVHDWWGHVYEHSDYPREIGNGQWGAFFHVKRTGTSDGSNATVVYRCKNANGYYNDGLVAWDNPWSYWIYNNKVHCLIVVFVLTLLLPLFTFYWLITFKQAYAEIHPAGYFDMIDWSEMEKNVGRGEMQYRAASNGSVIDVKATRDTTSEVVAIYALE